MPRKRPEGRLPWTFGHRRARLEMPHIATPCAPSQKFWEDVSMSHYQCFLV